MKYHFSADNYTHGCVVAPVNGFNSANIRNIATHAAVTSYSCCPDSAGASYDFSTGIADVLHSKMVVS